MKRIKNCRGGDEEDINEFKNLKENELRENNKIKKK